MKIKTKIHAGLAKIVAPGGGGDRGCGWVFALFLSLPTHQRRSTWRLRPRFAADFLRLLRSTATARPPAAVAAA